MGSFYLCYIDVKMGCVRLIDQGLMFHHIYLDHPNFATQSLPKET